MQHKTRNTPIGQNPEFLPSADTLELREFGRTLMRYKSMILFIVSLGIVLAALVTIFSKPVYRATATLQIEREPTKILDIDFLGSGDIRDPRDFYQTQFELIRSRKLAAAVINELNLQETLASTSLVGQLKEWIGLSSHRDRQTELEDLLLENMSVEPVRNSRLVAISFLSSDAQQAADIANAIANTFIKITDQERRDATLKAEKALETSLVDTRNKLASAEQQLNHYAAQHSILQLEGEDTSTEAIVLKALQENLVEVQKQRIEYQAQHPNSDTTVPNSTDTTLRSLQQQETQLKQEIAQAKASLIQQQDKLSTYNTLKNEVNINQELYQNLLQRMNEIHIAGSISTSNMEVIDQAQRPLKKFKPRLSTNLIIGMVLGLLIGVAIAFLRAFLDDTVKDVSSLERKTGLPMLGLIPETRRTSRKQLAKMVIRKPRSAIAEAFRSLRMSLQLLAKHSPQPIILITSSGANEGKSMTASNLAHSFASSGKQVLLIDTDLRSPCLQQLFNVANGTKGLVDYLRDHATTRDITQASDTPNLFVITAGQYPEDVQDPSELLASSKMQALLETASKEFDHIILDGPPVLGLADAVVLASLASQTLLSVHAEKTRMPSVEQALSRLQRANINPIATLLNRVDLNRNYGYDYGGYEYQPRQVYPTAVHKVLAYLKQL